MSNETENKTYFGADLIETGKKLYFNTKTADVHFSFRLDKDTVHRVPAHKSVLAATSDVFETMFYGELREKGDVQVTDASEAAFMEFLQFFYLKRVKLTIENVFDVMHLGHKYNVPRCAKVCVRFLKDVLTVDNIFIGLNLGLRYELQHLTKFCEDIVTLNTSDVFKTHGFLECDRPALAHILKMDVFSCTEVEVFEACMAWVRAKSNQNALTKAMVKKHLGDLYYAIRFKSMTMPALCSLQAEYETVLKNDFATITHMIVQPEYQAENFCNDKRHAKWNNNDIQKCDFTFCIGMDAPLTPSSYKLLNTQTTIFSVQVPLLLGSFDCGKIGVKSTSGIRDLGLSMPINVKVFEVHNSHGTNHSKLLLTMESKLQSMDVNYILLSHPVLVRPGFRYKICVGPFPDEYVFYSNELIRKVRLPNNGTVKCYKCAKGKEDGKVIGLISCLNFNEL